ncbi:MAG: hypothetical protein ACRD2W_23795, partial [Acidimicrobiales bacterium]
PELFAPGALAESLLAAVPDAPAAASGTSFAALTVMGAAVLVWSLDRSRTAADVRTLLVGTGAPLVRRKSHPRRLDLTSALNAARGGLVIAGVARRPLDRQEVVAATGLPIDLVTTVLDRLVAAGIVKESGGRYSPAGTGPYEHSLAKTFAAA